MGKRTSNDDDDDEPRFPAELVRPFRPSLHALLELAAPHVDDAMLRDIAEADYGHAADACFGQLASIRAHAALTQRAPFELQEVLALTRWRRPEGIGEVGLRQHRTRLFACACLLLAAELESPRRSHGSVTFEGESETVAPLIESALALGPDFLLAAGSLLAQRIQGARSTESAVFFALGLWLVAVLGAPTEPSLEAQIEPIAAFLERADAHERAHPLPAWSPEWLLGLTNYDQNHPMLRRLVRRAEQGASGLASEASRDVVCDVAARIFGSSDKVR